MLFASSCCYSCWLFAAAAVAAVVVVVDVVVVRDVVAVGVEIEGIALRFAEW